MRAAYCMGRATCPDAREPQGRGRCGAVGGRTSTCGRMGAVLRNRDQIQGVDSTGLQLVSLTDGMQQHTAKRPR